MTFDLDEAKSAISSLPDEDFPVAPIELADQLSGKQQTSEEVVYFFERLGPDMEIQSKDQAIGMLERSQGSTSMLEDEDESALS